MPTKLFAGFLLVGGVTAGFAQPISLHAPLTIPIPSSYSLIPAGFASADFNGDGSLDAALLVAASNGTGEVNGVLVFLGNGDGTFQPFRFFATVSAGAECLVVGDVNGDGRIDLIASGPDGTSVLLGNGDGTFAAPVQSAGGGCPLATGDFNLDGKLDIASISQSTSATSVFQLGVQLGSGEGHFREAAWTLNINASSLVVGDFNGDGKPDVAVALMNPDTGTVGVLLGRGDGTFAPIRKFGTAVPVRDNITQNAGGIATADFNQDGHLDLAVATGFPFRTDQGTIDVFLGNGDGSFQASQQVAGGSASFLTTGDLNGDGKPDLVAGESYLLGKGDGTFQQPVFLAQPDFQCMVETSLYCLYINFGAAIADLNKDGLADIMVATAQIVATARLGVSGTPPTYTYSLSTLLQRSGTPSFSATGVSAATFQEPVTAGSLASAFGSGLSQTTATATSPPWPNSLGGIQLAFRDLAGFIHLAPLLFVSPGQINYEVPPDLPDGVASIAVAPAGSSIIDSGQAINVSWDGAPSFFTVNGQGLAAANAVRVHPEDNTVTPVPVVTCEGSSRCTPVPIDVSGDPVFLSLYGTGFSKVSNLLDVVLFCSVNGNREVATAGYFGPQGLYPGLDQVNFVLDGSLAGSGDSAIFCFFTGGPTESTNVVHVTIK